MGAHQGRMAKASCDDDRRDGRRCNQHWIAEEFGGGGDTTLARFVGAPSDGHGRPRFPVRASLGCFHGVATERANTAKAAAAGSRVSPQREGRPSTHARCHPSEPNTLDPLTVQVRIVCIRSLRALNILLIGEDLADKIYRVLRTSIRPLCHDFLLPVRGTPNASNKARWRAGEAIITGGSGRLVQPCGVACPCLAKRCAPQLKGIQLRRV